jgi:hypothetical protein
MANNKNILGRAGKIIRSVNKILKESKSINEKESQPKLSKNEKFIVDSWNQLAGPSAKSFKTKVFESIPLIYAVSKKSDPSASDMITILNKNYDWDSSAKEWLLKVLTKIEGDKSAFKTFKDTIVAGTIDSSAPSLKELYGGKPIDSFIHANITKFYAKLKSVSKYNDKSKQFTADVVLFWGPGKVQDAFQGDLLKGMKSDVESLIKLKDGKTIMACVSLKALEGRVGKITSYMVGKFGQGIVGEGVMDLFKGAVNKVKDVSSSAINKMKEYATSFTEWVKNTKDELTNVFSPSNKSVADAQVTAKEITQSAEEVLTAFDNEIVEHMNRAGKPITEASDDEPIEISSCFREKLITWSKKFENDVKKYNKVFNEFEKNVSDYSTKNFFRLNFKELDTTKKEFNAEFQRIKMLIDKVKRAKEKEDTTGKKQKCLVLLDGTNPIKFTRKEIKNILMSNANFVAIQMLNNMVNDYLKKTNKSNTKDAISNLVKFATEINAEAVFGAAIDVPLIKYDGKVIIKYGQRDVYEVNHTKKMVDYFNSAKTIPIIGLRISPVQSKTGDVSVYYSITLYCLSDYKGSADSKPKDSDFIYNQIAFKCNSGSEFTFVIESDNVVTGDSVNRVFMG